MRPRNVATADSPGVQQGEQIIPGSSKTTMENRKNDLEAEQQPLVVELESSSPDEEDEMAHHKDDAVSLVLPMLTPPPSPLPQPAALPISAGHCRRVSFGDVAVREFNRIAGDHPDCKDGVPMTLDWKYIELKPMPVDDYEGCQRRHHRRQGVFAISSNIRREILQVGFLVSEEEIIAAERAATKAARQREQTLRQQHFSQKTKHMFQMLRGHRVRNVVAPHCA